MAREGKEKPMTVASLDHVNLRVRDMEATAAFFIEILDMTRSVDRPSWLLDERGHPVIHLGTPAGPYPSDAWRPFVEREGSGAVHHVALACSGYDAVVARLQAHGLDYDVNEVPAASLRQIFVEEPGGVLMELNFQEG